MSVEGQEGFRHGRMQRERKREKRHPQQRMVNRGVGGGARNENEDDWRG